MSRVSDQLSIYWRSWAIRRRIFAVVSTSPRRPFTCAQPVMPGFYIVTTRVKRNAPFEKLIMRQRVRAGDDERHFAGNDVQQLGQRVEIEAAQEALRDDPVETERVARQI